MHVNDHTMRHDRMHEGLDRSGYRLGRLPPRIGDKVRMQLQLLSGFRQRDGNEHVISIRIRHPLAPGL